jgi:two-component system nitrogen regulation sensor histidine kinase NtrY
MILYIKSFPWGIKMSQNRFLKNLYFYFFIISLVLAFIITFMMRNRFYPYTFTLLEKVSDNNEIKSFYYHDFDKDGFSETLELYNDLDNRYFLKVNGFSGGTIDQANYFEPIRPLNMLFFDLNGDSYDEIFCLTQDKDSLFLYVHDLISKQPVINRQFMVKTEAYLSPTGKYVAFFPACIADPALYKHKTFIFAIRSSSRLPRSAYAFDLEDRKIIKEFRTHAAFTRHLMYDLTGNGQDEIILTSAAWGNIHFDADYKDDRCWLFVLDQKLEPVFPPLSFSEYPAEIACFPLEVHTDRYLLVVLDYRGQKNIPQMIYIIDKSGNIHTRIQTLFKVPAVYQSILVSNENPSKIYGRLESNQLAMLNYRLELIDRIQFPYGRPLQSRLIDMTEDDQQDLVLLSKRFLTVYDKNLKLLGFTSVNMYQSDPSIRQIGINNPPEFGIHFDGQFNRFGFQKNIYSSLIFLLFIGLAVTNFTMLSLFRKFILLIATYRTIFHRFLFDSPNGIILSNPQGKIRYANNQITALLGLPQSPLKGEYIESVLNQHPEIINIFKACIKEKKPLSQKLHIDSSGNLIEIDLSIYPFGLYGKSCSLCLFEFKVPSSLQTSGKIATWSRAVQKIAHDIKTPLSTVNLNLKVLQTRLDKIQISKNERKELADDIAMMRTELENIQSMTKNFLKFTNLDKPHFQAFDLKQVIDDSVKKYRSYLNPDQDIQVTIDDDTKAIWADPQQIELVFNILIENALSAMQGKGMIQISASMAQYLDKDFSEYIEIEVADTGPGIRETNKSKIFEPYFTTKSEGTGMGLTIAKKIVEDHGCTIDVHSRANIGAVFVFSLPVVKEEENDG